MSDSESQFMKELKMFVFKTFFGLLLSAIGICTIFIFTTKFKLQEHDEKIIKLENEKADNKEIQLQLKNIDYKLEILTSNGKLQTSSSTYKAQ